MSVLAFQVAGSEAFGWLIVVALVLIVLCLVSWLLARWSRP